jgi:hypothetical protein
VEAGGNVVLEGGEEGEDALTGVHGGSSVGGRIKVVGGYGREGADFWPLRLFQHFQQVFSNFSASAAKINGRGAVPVTTVLYR